MRLLKLSLMCLVFTMTILINAYSEGPQWVVFDADYPLDFIDANSVVLVAKRVVRFWERAGNRTWTTKKGETEFAQYTLNEMNCIKKQERGISWDKALEDQNTVDGMKARTNFLKSTENFQSNYLTRWESIEPNKHSYARYKFVCKGMESK
jgi:hypothetical protein